MKAEAGGYESLKKERADCGRKRQFRPEAMNVMPNMWERLSARVDIGVWIYGSLYFCE